MGCRKHLREITAAGQARCYRLSEMDVSDDRGGTSDSDSNVSNSNRSHSAASSRKRFGLSRIVPEEGKKRVNYSKGDARRIMEEAVSLCEVMALGYEVVFHGRRRSYAAHSRPSIMGEGVRCEAKVFGAVSVERGTKTLEICHTGEKNCNLAWGCTPLVNSVLLPWRLGVCVCACCRVCVTS